MNRICVITALLLLSCPLSAQSIDGVWIAQESVRVRDVSGTIRDAVLTLHLDLSQQGESVRGTVWTAAIPGFPESPRRPVDGTYRDGRLVLHEASEGRVGSITSGDVSMQMIRTYDLRLEGATLRGTESVRSLDGGFTAPSKPFVATRPTRAAAAAELFGVGVFSTGVYELPPTFTPDGRTAYFTVSTPAYGRLHVIMETRLVNGRWTEPVVAPFSGRYGDADPIISPDGSRLFFLSRRPIAPGAPPRNDFDIFYVERRGAGWSDPVHVPSASGPQSEHYASVAADGTLYIAGLRPDNTGRGGDIYRVPLVNGAYGEPENLGPAINSADHHDTTPFIAPDQSYLIFGSFGRADAMDPAGDLYISFNRDGVWSPAVNLGPTINSTRTDYCPTVSHDGRFLYFASERGFADGPLERPLEAADLMERLTSAGNGLGDTYRVEMSAVLAAVGEN